ncbi:MAG: serine/threonine protein kinase [Pirellulaceae bacterium]|nr:serine/threonine protein kinase [Pirellulaceae bacterium]
MPYPDDPRLDPTIDAAREQDAVGDGLDTVDTTAAAGSVADTTPYVAVPPADAPTIPGYEITGLIAKGGMGRVYAARDLTLAREVAIKTLLPGANAERFVTEARITARLPHPGIPPVHALGTLAEGTPYLAMKLIRGQTLAELLEQRGSPDEKLPGQVQVFEQIAQAVGFAHARGIIHRDLKPLNVMVGEFGEVQVMDWGLAKDQAAPDRAPMEDTEATGTTETARTPEAVDLTADGAVMGTPGYMAPEQARGEAVDARADVFALGSILAVLLTGRPAFVGSNPRETITRAASADLAEILKQLDASGADEELVALAKSCLAADMAQRPADARAVAAEVADYRAGVEQRLKAAETEAAEALVREAEQRKRRRAMQVAAGAIFAVLLLGIAGTSLGLVVANRQRLAADQSAEKERLASLDAQAKEKLAVAAAEKERIATELTAERLRQIEMINNTIFDIFTEFDIRQVKQGTEPVEYVLAQKLTEAGKKLDAKAIHDPLVLASLQDRLGRTLLSLGEAQAAIEFLTSALAILQVQLGPEHSHTLGTMNSLAIGYQDAGKLDLALPLFEQAVQLSRAKLGPDHPGTLNSTVNLAGCYVFAGRLDLALPLIEETLQLQRVKLGPDQPETLASMNNLAAAYSAAGKLDLALTLYEETLQLSRAKLGLVHPGTLTSMNNLAAAYLAAGKLDLALPLFEETLQLKRVELGADHPDTLKTMNNLASGYRAAGKLDLALPLYRMTLQLARAKLGRDHPDTLNSLNSLAVGYQDSGKLDLALPLLKEVLELREAKHGPDHPDTLGSMNNLAAGYQAAGKLELALPLYQKTLPFRKAELGPDHPETLASMNSLAVGYHATGKLDLALPLYEETLQLRKAKLGPDHPETLVSMNNLAAGYQAVGKLELALPLYQETLQLRKDRQGPDHPETLASMNNLAASYWRCKQLDKSIPLFEETLRRFESKLGQDHPDAIRVAANLGVNYKDAERLAEALPLLEAAYRASSRHPSLAWVASPLLDAYVQAGEAAKGAALAKELLATARPGLPQDSPQLAAKLAETGRILMQLESWSDAEPIIRECLAIRQQAQPEAWLTFNSQAMLGAALLGQEKYAEAEPLLLAGYEGMKARAETIPPQAQPRLTEALDRLIDLYTATNNPDEVAKWQAERATYAPSDPQEPGK